MRSDAANGPWRPWAEQIAPGEAWKGMQLDVTEPENIQNQRSFLLTEN